MSSKRVVDALDTTDKDFVHWKMRFKAAAGAFEQGKFKDARDLMFRALNQAETLEDKSFAVPASNLAIAILSMEQNKVDEAKSYFDTGLRGANLRPDDAGRELYAAGLRYLAMWQERNGTLDEAESRLRESVGILEKLPNSDTQLAYSLSDLSFILVRNGNISEAQKTVRKAMQLLTDTVGKDQPQYDFAKMIFEVCLNQNDEKSLMDMFELSASKLQYKMGSKYPNLVRALNAYAAALKERGLTEELDDAKENFSALMRAS
ncbi:MAG: tetratricopeptide repeat protein [Candidatus Melainabacteria bacterium]|nr:tetratricopeptide repeat protein [Candidatus Melainabacteria bacterium]